MSVRIAVSLRGQMRALASQGIFVTDCHSQLQSILLQKLGPEHAALLAEPQHDAGGQSVDWYAQGSSQARCLKDLPEEEGRALQARAGALARDIQDLAQNLPPQDISKHLLLLALQHPSADDLWEVDGKAVLINWGFAPGAVGAQPQDLTRLGAAVPPPPPPPPAAVPAPGGCLPWLLPLLLLALLLCLLLAALGLAPSPFPSSCFRVDTAALAEEKNRAAHLDEDMAALWRQLQERAALCRPPAPAPRPEETLPPPPTPEVVEPFLGETPPEPEKPVEKNKPKAKAEKPVEKPKPKKNEDLTIPDDAASKNDLAFLEGCWTSETGLFSHPSREPITAEYCFDKKGKGRRFVRERNGQVCSGPAQAGFSGNRLQFNADPARCPRGGSYVPQKVDCTGSENSTQCKGNELGGSRNQWDARFKRK